VLEGDCHAPSGLATEDRYGPAGPRDDNKKPLLRWSGYATARCATARLRIFLWEQAYKPGSVTGPLTLPSPPSRGARSMRSYQTATISLGRLLPDASCSLPGDAAGRLISPYVALHRAGFAQVSGHPEPRALLPHDCTLTLNHSLRSDTGRRPVPEPQANGAGRYVSVALSLGSPPLGVTQRPALWCPDFPLRACASQRSPGLLPRLS